MKTRLLGFLSFVLHCFLFAVGSANAEVQVRQALIIGNAEYQQVAPLKNSVNDAVLMNETLKSTGFKTRLLTNASKQEMNSAIEKFAKSLRPDGVALFYFAGHGLEVNGKNYLVPVDANLYSEAVVEYDTVDAGRLLSIFKSVNNGLNLMILDACRDNPFATNSSWRNIRRSGLAPMRPATGSLVLYATEPGNVASDNEEGKNGLFTKSLVKYMKQPGLKIEDVFKRAAIQVREDSGYKQTPYSEGYILGDFIFTENKGVTPIVTSTTLQTLLEKQVSVTKTTTPENNENVTDELEVWSQAQASNNPEAYRKYLRLFPKGTFSMVALMRLEELGF